MSKSNIATWQGVWSCDLKIARLQNIDTLRCCGLEERREKTVTILEQLGIEYEEKDGIYYPLLSVNQEHSTLLSVGKYGDMWVHFMEEENPDRW